MPRYRRRPDEVEAIRWVGFDEREGADRIPGVVRELTRGFSLFFPGGQVLGVFPSWFGAETFVRIGEWIVRDGNALRVMDHEDFLKRYEFVAEEVL